MSIQGGPGIPLSLRPDDQQQAFRLLELPPELLALLTSEQPPTLQLKSTEGLAGEPGGAAVLCTADKTFNVRQKNSSNTVYVFQPKNQEPGQDGIPLQPGLEAVSQSYSTLETMPVAKSPASAYIRRLLPIVATTGTAAATREPLTKARLFANVPFSDAQCEDAARELAMFEDSNTGQCLLPSAQLKIKAWQSILENMTANAIVVTTPLEKRHIEVLREGLEDLPSNLFEAILNATVSTSDSKTNFDRDRLPRWVGIAQLEVDAAKSAISTASFKQAWKNRLPELWRAEIDVARLSDRATLIEGGKSIVFRDYGADLEVGVDGSGAAEAKSALGIKRKWHEKFRPAAKKGG